VTPLAYIALFGWPLFVILLMALWPGRATATFAVVGAWLLLPPYSLPISGLPDYSKSVAATIGLVIGTLLFDPRRVMAFRPRWFDLPVAVCCVTGIPTMLANGLTLYDGLSDTMGQVIVWGLPYLLGRLYYTTPDDMRAYTVAMAFGGVGYILPCLYEVRMSPQLLHNIYGLGGWHGYRLGGYRPNVFFMTGLECGMWMTAAMLSAWWLWYRGVLTRIGSYSFTPVLLLLAVTTVFCRSTGALALLVGGLAILWISARFRTRLFLAALLLIGPVYVGVRLPNIWSGQQAVDLANALVGPDRAQSLEWRFRCERILGDHGLERPILGWGGYGRNLVFLDEAKTKVVPPDGLWIGAMTARGYVGLIALYLFLALPALRLVRRFPARLLLDPRMAGATLAATLLGLYLVDCLANAFVNIIYITMAGGLMNMDPRQLRGEAGPELARGRVAGRARGAAGIGVAGVAAPSGQALLADRCRALGRSLKQQGRLDEADAAWRQALGILAALVEAAPGDDATRRRWCDCANDLAWLRANRPDARRRDPAAAVGLARRATEEYPDAPAFWNTLGAALYRAGDAPAAIAALERALDLAGGTAFDEVFLAMARARAGDAEGARQALALAMIRAERDHPGHPELTSLCDEAHALIAGGAAAPATLG
jgi:tetratricopeptide (TPR) repeat protein